MVSILPALWGIRIRGLWKLSDGRDWWWGKLGLVLMGGAMLSKSLIQLSVDGWGCVPSLLFDLRPNYGGGDEANSHLLQKVPCMHCYIQCLWPCSRLPPTPLLKTPGHSQASPRQSLVGSLLLSPGSWCAQGLVCALRESVSPALCKYWELYGRINGNLFQKGLYHTQVCCTQSTCPCPCHRPLLTRTSAWDTPTLKGRSGLVSVASAVVHKVLFEPSKHLWWVWGLILNVIFVSPIILLGLVLCPYMWGIFFWWHPISSCQWLFSSEL